MDRKKLEAALERLEDEQFGRTFNMPGIDPAVVGGWLRWIRDIKLEQPEPEAVIEAVPQDGKHGEA
jgi:hypothetical protein